MISCFGVDMLINTAELFFNFNLNLDVSSKLLKYGSSMNSTFFLICPEYKVTDCYFSCHINKHFLLMMVEKFFYNFSSSSFNIIFNYKFCTNTINPKITLL